MKKAIVFGAYGQAGRYMTDLLISRGYEIIPSTARFERFQHVGDFELKYLFEKQPDEIYNFAAKTSKKDSWDDPTGFLQVNGIAVVWILEAIAKYCPKAKFFNAGSADVFSKNALSLYGFGAREDSDRGPCNPYGLSKCWAEDAVSFYRYHKDLFACTGIFFNMESPRRKTGFVHHIISEVVRINREWIMEGKRVEKLKACNLAVKRDWGLTSEYVEAAWLMLQASTPADYVIATGETNTCLHFVRIALDFAGLSAYPMDEFVELSLPETSLGSGDDDVMRADPSKIKDRLGWEAKSKFTEVVRTLVLAELGKESAIGKASSNR